MGAIEPWHLIVILVIVLIIFGPGKLTDVGASLGKGIREFRDAAEKPAPPKTVAATTCAGCGTTLAAGASFCSQCGKAVQQP